MSKEYGWLFYWPMEEKHNGGHSEFESSKPSTWSEPQILHEPYPKFARECCMGKIGDRILLLDGVIMNWNYDSKEDRLHTWANRLVEDPVAYAKLEGSFNGFVVDLSKGEGTFFTNPTGERTVYYFSDPAKGLFVASNYNLLADRLHREGIACALDTLAFRSMVVFGGMHDDRTWIQGVHRLMPGKALHVSWQGSQIKCERQTYHEFNSSHPDSSKRVSDWIAEIDASFRHALTMDLDKDAQHGYTSLIDISGGLDSRMNVFVARDMGYENVLLLSYAAMGSNEQKIAQEIAQRTGYPLLFSSIDDGRYLCDLEELVRLNYGASYYVGITGGKRLLSMLSERRFGLEHTGLLGEMSNGSYLVSASTNAFRLNPHIAPGEDHMRAKADYPNDEMFYFHTRGPLWGLGSMITRRSFTETYSAFMHTDFQELSYRIPVSIRIESHIFLEWMKQCVPEAAQVPYAKDMVPPAAPVWKKNLHRKILFRLPGLKRRILRKMAPNRLKADTRSMNPLDFYYERNETIRTFIDSCMNQAIELTRSYDEFQDISQYFMENPSSIYEKAALLTAWEAWVRYVEPESGASL